MKIALITILGFFFSVLTVQLSYAQISPGELSNVHSHLEGISNCTQCHDLGKKVSKEKCLSCHTEVKTRVDQKKGFHSSSLVNGKECIRCHSDHNGLKFQIVRFSKDTFNHDLTGYILKGTHRKKECENCHKPDFIVDSKIKSKDFTFLGLQTECLTCHTDYHKQTLPSQCENCHSFDAFKPASNFDHKKTSFQLEGKHQQIACELCHKTTTVDGVKFQKFKGIQAEKCTNCHKDVHNNKFGQNCSDCHNYNSFKNASANNEFDHNKTDFNLKGKHQQVNCKSCHKEKLTTPINFEKCSNCHVDYHKQQFVKNEINTDCSSCHNENGFSEFNFSVEQHNSNTFPLNGAHLATPCFECHKKEDRWEFRQIGQKCNNCHEDIHKNLISEKYYPNSNCEVCHTTDRWSMVTFNHNRTEFLLEGAHAKQSCRSCHFNKEKTGHSTQHFVELTKVCTQCHNDLHKGQFEENGNTDCKKCHNNNAFIPAQNFNHNASLFPLDGKHKDLACNKCHSIKSENGGTYVWYKIEDFKCENCHQ